MLLQEKYESPHKRINNAEFMLENSSFSSQSINNSPALPRILVKRNLKSSSPSKIRVKKDENENKKSIFFPKIENHSAVSNIPIDKDNEFIDERSSFVRDNYSFFRKAKPFVGKLEEKVFRRFPEGFFPDL